MLDDLSVAHTLRNLGIYTVGVGLAVGGALGLADAIDLTLLVAAPAFVAGLVLVVAVHESLGGPI